MMKTILFGPVAAIGMVGCTPFMETGSEMEVVEVDGYRVFTQFQTESPNMWAGRFDNFITIPPSPVRTREIIKKGIEVKSGCEVIDESFTYDVRTFTGYAEVNCRED